MLVEQGQLWDIVMSVIQGSVLIERENIEVADGGFIGNSGAIRRNSLTPKTTLPSTRWPTAAHQALEFFGESHFTQTSR